MNETRIAAALAAYEKACAPRSETSDADYRAWVALADELPEEEKIALNARILELP